MAPVTGNARVDLAAHLTEALAGKDVQVYDGPPDTFAIPAVVVVPAEPYVQPGSMGGPWFLQWNFQVQIMVQRGAPVENLGALEELIYDVALALVTQAPVQGFSPRWVDVSRPEQMSEEGAEYLAAIFAVQVRN